MSALLVCVAPQILRAQSQSPAPQPTAPKPTAPAWAQPGSATHTQVAPPSDFHRPSRNFNTPLGIFDGQSDVGSALLPGSASYAAGQYTIHAAGYNIWYTRDEFTYLWNKMSGDVSLAANIAFPDPTGYGDRKAVLVIRQNLDDTSQGGACRPARCGHDPTGGASRESRSHERHGVSHWRPRTTRRRDSQTAWSASRPNASELKSEATPLRSSSAWKANPCTSSGHPSTCICRNHFMSASASARTCRINPIQRYFPMSCWNIPPERFSSRSRIF